MSENNNVAATLKALADSLPEPIGVFAQGDFPLRSETVAKMIGSIFPSALYSVETSDGGDLGQWNGDILRICFGEAEELTESVSSILERNETLAQCLAENLVFFEVCNTNYGGYDGFGGWIYNTISMADDGVYGNASIIIPNPSEEVTRYYKAKFG